MGAQAGCIASFPALYSKILRSHSQQMAPDDAPGAAAIGAQPELADPYPAACPRMVGVFDSAELDEDTAEGGELDEDAAEGGERLDEVFLPSGLPMSKAEIFLFGEVN